MQRASGRLPFSGILIPLDVPSESAARASRGRRFVVSKSAAHRALSSLKGKPVTYTDGDGAECNIGVVTQAKIRKVDGKPVVAVAGDLFTEKQPREVMRVMNSKSFGVLAHLGLTHVQNIGADPWVLDEFTFAGVEIGPSKHSVFCGTSLQVGTNEMMDDKDAAAMQRKAPRRLVQDRKTDHRVVSRTGASHQPSEEPICL